MRAEEFHHHIEKMGYEFVRLTRKGAHRIYRNPLGATVTIDMNDGYNMDRYLARYAQRDARRRRRK